MSDPKPIDRGNYTPGDLPKHLTRKLVAAEQRIATLEFENARLKDALAELEEAADVFGLELPRGEYRGLGNLRAAIRLAKVALSSAPHPPSEPQPDTQKVEAEGVHKPEEP